MSDAYNAGGPAYGYDPSFFTQRGIPRANFDPRFGDRLQSAVSAAERATGTPGSFSSGYRTPEEQAYLYRRFQNGGPLAAPPGQSRHNYGAAADLNAGPVRDWVRSNAGNYGLETIRGDDPHIQLASADYNKGGPQVPDNSGGPDYNAMLQAMGQPQDNFGDRLSRAGIYLMGISNPQALSGLGAANRDAAQRSQQMLHILGMQQQQRHFDAQMAEKKISDAATNRRLDQADQRERDKIDLQTAPKDAITGRPIMPQQQGAPQAPQQGAGDLWGQGGPADLARAQAALRGPQQLPSPPPDIAGAYGQAPAGGGGGASPFGPALQAIQPAQAGPYKTLQDPWAQPAASWGQSAPQPAQQPQPGVGAAGATGVAAPTAQAQPQATPPSAAGAQPQLSEGDYNATASRIRAAIGGGMTPERALSGIKDPGMRGLVQGWSQGAYNPDASQRVYDPQTRMARILASAIYGDKNIEQAWKTTQQQSNAWTKENDPTTAGSVESKLQAMDNVVSNLFTGDGKNLPLTELYDKLQNKQVGVPLLAHGIGGKLPEALGGAEVGVPGINTHKFGQTGDYEPAFNAGIRRYMSEANKLRVQGNSNGVAEERGANPESTKNTFFSVMQPNEFRNSLVTEMGQNIQDLKNIRAKAIESVGGPNTQWGQEMARRIDERVAAAQGHMEDWLKSHPEVANPTANRPYSGSLTSNRTGVLPTSITDVLRRISGGQ